MKTKHAIQQAHDQRAAQWQRAGSLNRQRALDRFLREIDTSSNMDDMTSPYEDDLDA